MSVNREQGLFLAVVVGVGLFGYLRFSDGYQQQRQNRPKRLEVAVGVAPPDVSIPSEADPRFDIVGRDTFQPPQDWNPLGLLSLDLPPLPEISAIGPLTDPATDPAHFPLFRHPPTSTMVDPELAVEDSSTGSVAAAAGDGGEPAARDPRSGGTDFSGGSAARAPAAATPDEATLLKSFDWIRAKTGPRKWGNILNDNRLALLDNQEPIKFKAVSFDGKGAITATFERSALASGGVHGQGFGLADTVQNRVALKKRSVDPKSNAGSLLTAAQDCLGWVGEDEGAAVNGADYFADLALAQNRTSPEAWILKGIIREHNYDTDGELGVYEDAREAGVDTSELKTRRARVLRRIGLPGKAEELLQEAVAQNPNDFRAFLELGALYRGLNRGRDAVAALTTAEDLARNRQPEERLEARLELARAQIQIGEFAEAGRQIDSRVAQQGIAHAQIHVLRGVCHLLAGDTSRAIGQFSNALELDPREHDAVYNLGIAAVIAGDAVQARQRFVEAADLDPLRGFESSVSRGILEEMLGNLTAAMSWYTNALELHPGEPFGLYRAGRAARRLGNLDAAFDLLHRCLLEDGRIVDVLNELGYVELLRDSGVAAEAYLSESLRREAGNAEALILLGAAVLRRGDVRTALKVFEDAIANADERTSPAAYCGAAWCLYRQGMVEQAVGRFAEARAAAQTVGDETNRSYADANQKAIDDHRRKEEWIDSFKRDQIKNNWLLVEGNLESPKGSASIELRDSVVHIQGTQRRTEAGRMTELQRELEMTSFVLFEADIAIAANSEGIAGVRWVVEKTKKSVAEAYKEFGIGFDRTGAVFLLHRKDHDDIPIHWEPAKDPEGVALRIDPSVAHRLTIERTDFANGEFAMKVDERVVAKIPDASLRAYKKLAKGGLFVFADGLKKVDVTCTQVRIVRYREDN